MKKSYNSRPSVPGRFLWTMVALAAALWFYTFFLPWSNFWIKISLSAAFLATLSFCSNPLARDQFHFNRSAWVRGLISAVALYAVFWLGKNISELIFPFTSQQIGAIYGKGDQVSLVPVFFLLLLVTGPSEEIFWRGFLQKNLMDRYGRWQGWIAATAIYAGVHIWSFNFMLIGAAAVAGAFWGYLYMRWDRLAPIIVSHSIWSAFVFTIVPLH